MSSSPSQICSVGAGAAYIPGLGNKVFALSDAVLIGGFYLMRLRGAGVQMRSDQVVVRNPFRTQTFPLDAVQEFSVGSWGIFPRIGLLHLRDGSSVHIWAIESANPLTRPHDRGAEDVVDELNKLLTDSHSVPDR